MWMFVCMNGCRHVCILVYVVCLSLSLCFYLVFLSVSPLVCFFLLPFVFLLFLAFLVRFHVSFAAVVVVVGVVVVGLLSDWPVSLFQ